MTLKMAEEHLINSVIEGKVEKSKAEQLLLNVSEMFKSGRKKDTKPDF
jgi:hypothetical protein